MLAQSANFELIQNIATAFFLVLIGIVFVMLVNLQNKIDSVRSVIMARLESHDTSVNASWAAFLNHTEIIRAHEMRTPLTVIQAHLTMLAQQDGLPDEMRRDLAQTALERTKELTRVVDKYQAEGSR